MTIYMMKVVPGTFATESGRKPMVTVPVGRGS